MIPNQYRQPSARNIEAVRGLLDDGHELGAMVAMDYTLGVVKSEREQLRADRDAARTKLRAMDQIAAMKHIHASFVRIGEIFKSAFTSLQKPPAKSDYTKVS